MRKIKQLIGSKVEELRQNVFVIRQLVARDKKRSVSSTFMGELWEILNPLINMVVMVLVFGKMLGGNIENRFPLYVLTGTMLYGLFASGTTMCLDALFGNRTFLIKTQIGKNIYILEKILLAFRNFLFSSLIYIFVLVLYRVSPDAVWLLVIPDILLLLIMMIGVGKMLAVINVTFADITYFYKIFTLMLFYGSALFYQIERMSGIMQKLLLVNPVYVAIAIARECVMKYQFADWKMWIILSSYAVGCYVVGTCFFNKKIENIVAQM